MIDDKQQALGDLMTANMALVQLNRRREALNSVDEDGLSRPMVLPGVGYVWALRS